MKTTNPNLTTGLKQMLLEKPFWPLLQQIQQRVERITMYYDPEYAGTLSIKVAPYYDEAAAWLGKPSATAPQKWSIRFDLPVISGGNYYRPPYMDCAISPLIMLRKSKLALSSAARKLRRTITHSHEAEVPPAVPGRYFMRVDLLNQQAACQQHPNDTIPWRVMDIYLTVKGESSQLNYLCVRAAARILQQELTYADQVLCDCGRLAESDF